MNSELEKIPENVDPHSMGFYTIEQWSVLTNSLRTMIVKQGPFQSYKAELEHNKYQGTSPDRPLQVTILDHLSVQLYKSLLSHEEQTHPAQRALTLTFIGFLFAINIMTHIDEEYIIDSVKKRSKLKNICESMLEKIKDSLGDSNFSTIKKESINFLVANKSIIFDSSFQSIINLQVPAFQQHHEATWNKIFHTIDMLHNYASERIDESVKQSNDEADQNLITNDYLQLIPQHLSKQYQSGLESLFSFQQNNQSGKSMYQNLKVIQAEIELLCQFLHNYISAKQHPSKENAILIQCIFKLNFEMIACYEVVISWAVKSLFFHKGAFIESLQASMHCYTKVLFYAFEQHIDVPKKAWLGLHQCYLLALNHKVHNKSLKKPQNWHSQLKTLDSMYKYCLLMSAINPYQLQANELKVLKYALEHWASLITLTKDENAILSVDLESDRAPHVYNPGMSNSNETYKVKLNKVKDTIQNLINVKHNSHSSKLFTEAELSIPNQLLKGILETWDYSFIMNNTNESVSTSLPTRAFIGISSITHLINHELKYLDESKVLISDQNITSDKVEEIEINNVSASKYQMIHQSYICEIIEFKGNQYVLKWKGYIPTELRCGELITVQKYQDRQGTKWELGTISAVKNQGSYYLVFVTILCKDIMAITGHSSDSSESDKPLLMSAASAENQCTTIFAPAFPLKEGQEITITVEGKTYSAYLAKVVNESAYYKQFNTQITNV